MLEDDGKKPIIIHETNNHTVNKKPRFRKEKLNYKWIAIIILFIIIIIAFSFLYLKSKPKTEKKGLETIKDSVVKINIYNKDNEIVSTGSGFCIYKSNYIITNYHVIKGAYKITLTSDANEEILIDNILIFNPQFDVAILEGDFNFAPLERSKAEDLKAGQEITTIGSPEGELNTVSTGIISNADNDYEIRITAPISPGSSGRSIVK